MSQTTTTPNYNLIKPNVNSDNDLWGDHLNSDMDIIDTKLKAVENKSGVVSFNTRSGTVSLLQADVTTVLPPGAGTPAMDGTATAGALLTWSRSDHVHPTDTTRYAASNPAGYVTAAQAGTAAPVQSVATRTGAVVLTHNDLTDWAATLAPYATLASPALTGSPTAPTVTPSTDNSTKLATTAFVQSAASVPSSTAPIMDGTAAPGVATTLSRGDHVHPSDTSRAPLASPALTGSPTAPTPLPATDNSTNIATTAFVQTAVGTANHNVGRNLIHNGMYAIQQRGAGPWTANLSYTADRWSMYFAAGTLSVSINAVTDASRAQIGDEAAASALVATCVGSAGASDETFIVQNVEGVRRTAGKTIILSFWAAATAGTPKLGTMVYQGFGSGGSPSGPVIVPGQSVTLSTSFARYAVTLSLPSVAGKSFGTTAGTDMLAVRFGLSAGATAGINYGNPGVQSYTLQLWGVQCEVAAPGQTQPTPLEKPDPRYDLSNCQRFYSTQWAASYNYGANGLPWQYTVAYPVTMRATPTVTFASSSSSGVTVAVVGGTPQSVQIGGNASFTGGVGLQTVVNASADL